MTIPAILRTKSPRALTVALFSLILAAAYIRTRPDLLTSAAEERDPNVIWSIGREDNSPGEFGLNSAPEVAYEIGRNSPRDWPQQQKADVQVSTIDFRLDSMPSFAPVLALDGAFIGVAPRTLELRVNGKRGSFRIRPIQARDLDQSTSYMPTYARTSLRIPLDASLLRAGRNKIALLFHGDGGSLNYDRVALMKGTSSVPDLQAFVEPTIFYKRYGEQLKEIAEVVIQHSRPAGRIALELRIAGSIARRAVGDDGQDFGERVVEVEVPALLQAARYTLKLNGHSFEGDFAPEKRWRLFAGLKIHNDVGFTDLQQNVQALDVRNTDGVLELMRKFPFYKFNFDDAWLADSYLRARKPARRSQMLQLAAERRIGINAFYLNLATGLCTGEELYRALYFAKSLERRHRVPMESACITDAPSHSWFLPTLLADAGVKGFAVGSNQFRAPLLQNSNLNEDSPFYWIGADGTKLMSWFARNYQGLYRLTGSQPSIERMRRTIPQFLARYRRGDYPVDAVLIYGLYTDNAEIGNGDAQAIKDWNAAYAFPKIIPATDADYYDYIAKNFGGKLSSFRGDAGAYWEDGAASTAAETALNRDTQRLLPTAETAASLAAMFDRELTYPAGELRDAWTNLLFYDEHTWGSHHSIAQPDRPSVNDQWQYKRGYALRAQWVAKDVLTRSLNHLVQNISTGGPTLFVFNLNGEDRTDVVETELGEKQSIVDAASGEVVPLDVHSGRDGFRIVRFLAHDVPGIGYKAYLVKSGKTEGAGNELRGGYAIESRYYRLEIDPQTGAIARLYDKQLNRDLVDAGAGYKLNELLYVSGGKQTRIIEDIVGRQPPKLDVSGQRNGRVLSVEKTPGGQRIRIRAGARRVPEIETEISVYDAIKRIDIVNRIRKEEVREKEALYFAFPFALSKPRFAYQVQNAFVRPNQDQLPGAAREWFATQNVISASDAGAAIAWATPDAPMVTLTDINRGRWLKHLDVRNGHVFSYAMNNYWFTNYKASQGGEFTFRYFITSGATLDNAELSRFDASTRSPFIVYGHFDKLHVRLDPINRRMPAPAGRFFRIESPNAQLVTLKQAEDENGYILRLKETAGTDGVARISSTVFRIQQAWLASGVEDNRKLLPVHQAIVEVPLKAHRYATLRLVLR
jgi:alpha-mannosidase